jgi:hypothetical protein
MILRRATLPLAAVATLALLAAPSGQAGSSHPTTGAARVQEPHNATVASEITDARIVTLITGDRVRIETMSDGDTLLNLMPGSPHLGEPARTFQLGRASYLLPRLTLAQSERFDPSLFNATALSRFTGHRVPITVTFAPDVRPHPVPGLVLTGAGQRSAAGTESRGYYSTAAAPSPRPAKQAPGDSWRGVTAVRLPAGLPPAAPSGRPTHTLTLHVTNTQGNPVRFELAFVMNVDDSNRFLRPVRVRNGVASVRVPAGNYAVFAGSVLRFLVAPDFAVIKDTTLSMSLSDATTQPSEHVPGHTAVGVGFTLQRDPARGGWFAEGTDYSWAAAIRAQPVRPTLPQGDLKSFLNADMAPSPDVHKLVYPSIAYVNDYRDGVPARMSFTHPRSDFAIVPEQYYANGPRDVQYADVVAAAPGESLVGATSYAVHAPGIRPTWLQGDHALLWIQDFTAIAPSIHHFGRMADVTKFSRYLPGDAAAVRFAHGPVGPGLEATYDQKRTGPRCDFCRTGDILHGDLPLFSGAGTGMQGFLWSAAMGSWSLNHAGDQLQSGVGIIDPYLTLPQAWEGYTLHAESRPGVQNWQLSTDVRDTWWFRSGGGKTAVPLLMPSYVPHTALGGWMSPGPTGFRLDFGNIGPANAEVTHATVSLSTNGGTSWHPATVTRLDRNSFAVTYRNPAASSTGHTMSLRVVGIDQLGRKVVETAISAYRLVSGGPGRP